MSDKIERPSNIEKVYRPATGASENGGTGFAQNTYKGPTGSGEPKNPPSQESAVPAKKD